MDRIKREQILGLMKSLTPRELLILRQSPFALKNPALWGCQGRDPVHAVPLTKKGRDKQDVQDKEDIKQNDLFRRDRQVTASTAGLPPGISFDEMKFLRGGGWAIILTIL